MSEDQGSALPENEDLHEVDTSDLKLKNLKRATRPILEKLKELGIAIVEARYSGSGDCGYVDDIDATLKDSTLFTPLNWGKNNTIDALITKDKFIDGKYVTSCDVQSVTLECAIESLLYDWLDITHKGWENNDGGDGTLTINVNSETITLQHRDFIVEYDESEYSL